MSTLPRPGTPQAGAPAAAGGGAAIGGGDAAADTAAGATGIVPPAGGGAPIILPAGGGVPAAGAGLPIPPPIILPVAGGALATFIFSPWQGEIDLSTKQGKALWDEGICPIEVKFNGFGRDVTRFLALVCKQVTKCCWTAICHINGKSLLSQYGEIQVAEVTAAQNIQNATVI